MPMRAQEVGPLHEVLGYLLAAASVKTSRVFSEHAEGVTGLKKVEYTVLELLTMTPDLTAKRLGTRLGFTQASTSVWLDKMVAKGVLERRPSEADKRSFALVVTPLGAQLLQQAREGLQAGEKLTLRHLSPAEQAMLKELLRKYALSST